MNGMIRSGWGAPNWQMFKSTGGTPIYIDLENLKLYCLRGNNVEEVGGGAGPGAAVWGDITGSLSDQTDLQSAIDAKAATSSLASVAFSGSYTQLLDIPATFTPSAHTQASATISDSTTTGRAVLTAADQAAARAAIGAGTSSFNGAYASLSGIPSTFAPIIGGSGTQACAGNDSRLSDARNPLAHNQAASTISDSTATGRAVLTAVDAAAARTVIGAGTSNSVVRNARTTSQRTTTSASLGNVTDLSIAINANEIINFDAYLFGGCNNTGGSQFSVTIPSGASCRVQWTGNTNAATAFTTGVITASDGVSPTFYTISSLGRTVEGHGVVVNGANAGSIQVRFKSVTATQTTTVEPNSYITGRVH